MAVFRLQSNVPEVFVNKSRDFQLFCRLYDCIFDGVKVNIDSMLNILDARSCDNIILQLLQSKIGFFTRQNFTADELRVVLDAFPTIIKNKGSLKGIKQAINAFLKAHKLKTGAYVTIVNEKDTDTDDEDKLNIPEYTINIGIESDILNTSLLDVLFYYILPTGYNVTYYFYTGSSKDEEFEFSDSDYRLVFSNPYVTESLDVAVENSDVDASLVGVSNVSKFYQLSDESNPDIEQAHSIADYSKKDAVCGYYNGTNFYYDRNYQNMIIPIGESNKLCYYDIKNRNFYVYTSSFNGPDDTGAKYVLIVHEEKINNA